MAGGFCKKKKRGGTTKTNSFLGQKEREERRTHLKNQNVDFGLVQTTIKRKGAKMQVGRNYERWQLMNKPKAAQNIPGQTGMSRGRKDKLKYGKFVEP